MFTVGVDDALRFVFADLNTKRLQLLLELGSAHTVAAPKDSGLAYKPFVLGNVGFWLVVNLRSHDLVHVLAIIKGYDQVILPC